MKLNEKVQYFRETKRLSQESVAYELGITQSQYSRRESGAIKFNSDEIALLGKLFEVSASELFGDESVIFNNTNQKGGNFGQYIAMPEELINQYESRLKEKDEMIVLLREKIALLKK